MHQDRLDVIVRFHDSRRYPELRRALFSLVCQTYRPLSVHVVSQRFEGVEVDRLQRELDPFRELGGDAEILAHNFAAPEPVDARSALINLGIANAVGRYLAFLDYDDVIYPEAYRLLIDELERSDAVVAFGGIAAKRMNVVGDAAITMGKEKVFKEGNLVDLFRDNFCPIHSYVIERARVERECLRFDERLSRHEDYEFLLRLCARYPSSFALVGRFVGDYYLKDDGSNTILVPSSVSTERLAEWRWSGEFVERQRNAIRVDQAVQQAHGVSVPYEAMTIAEFIDWHGGRH